MTAPKYKEDLINEIIGVKDKELVSVIPVGYPAQDPPAPAPEATGFTGLVLTRLP